MSLEDLYQDLILDHGTKPRNFKNLEHFSHEAEGFNPLCGDKVSLKLQVNSNDQIQAACFQGAGCAISMAAASLMTEFLKNKTIQEAQAQFEFFQAWILCPESSNNQNNTEVQETKTRLGKLEALSGVKKFPARVKCATLAWHTLAQALKNAKS